MRRIVCALMGLALALGPAAGSATLLREGDVAIGAPMQVVFGAEGAVQQATNAQVWVESIGDTTLFKVAGMRPLESEHANYAIRHAMAGPRGNEVFPLDAFGTLANELTASPARIAGMDMMIGDCVRPLDDPAAGVWAGSGSAAVVATLDANALVGEIRKQGGLTLTIQLVKVEGC